MTNTCKMLDEPLTLEEQHVLRVCLRDSVGIQPDEYFEHIILAIYIAMTADGRHYVGYLTQLAKVHPEYCHAVDCLVNGNLYARYHHQKLSIAVSV